MEKNVGALDRWIRVAGGAGILVLGAYLQSWFGLLGIVPITTALLGWCPIYTLIGVGSCNKNGK